MKPLVIIGAGGFGREVAWLVERINQCKEQYKILGFIDDNVSIGSPTGSYKVIGKISDLKSYDENLNIAIAIGNSHIRKKVFERIIQIGSFQYPNLIDPTTIVDETRIGIGNIVCAYNVFTVDYRLQDFNYINLGCTISHDVNINSFVSIYSGVNISGSVILEECIELGTGSSINQGLIIKKNSIIGAGTVVIRDIKGNVTVVGVPGKVLKRGNNNE